MFCPRCGKEISDDASFCGDCGRPVQSVAPAAPKRKFPGKVIAILISLSFVLIVVGAITAANFLADRALSQDDILNAIESETELCEPIEGLSGIEDPEYSIASFEITSRKTNTDNGSDDIQCRIVLENGVVRINRTAQLCFGKYDQGWVLDSATELEYSFEPLAAPVTGLEDVATSIEFDPESNSCRITEPFECGGWYGAASGSIMHLWSFDSVESGWWEQDSWTETSTTSMVDGAYFSSGSFTYVYFYNQDHYRWFDDYVIAIKGVDYDGGTVDLSISASWEEELVGLFGDDGERSKTFEFIDGWTDDGRLQAQLTEEGFEIWRFSSNGSSMLQFSADAELDENGHLVAFYIHDTYLTSAGEEYNPVEVTLGLAS